MAKKVVPEIETFARIKVVGVGGAGGAAVNRMIESGVKGIDFIAVNTDAQDLHHSKARTKLHIGKETTRGLGAGADPSIGQKAAEESREEIKAILEGTDMVFITLGAGGGTGSGAAHIIAEIAKGLDILTVAFATKPFVFEGDRRRRNADFAIQNLRKYVDTLVVIPNDRLLQTIDRKTPLPEAFKIADDVLRQGVQGISDLITVHGIINLDFADVKAIMANAGSALMGIGRASGDDRATVAALQAIESPLLEVSIDGARGILFNIIGGNDMAMHEINAAAEAITDVADQDVNVIFGATINPDIKGEVIVTVVATGFDEAYTGQQRSTIDEGDERHKDGSTTDAKSEAEEPSIDVDDEDIIKDIDTTLQSEGELDKEVVDSFSQDNPKSMWDDDIRKEDEFDEPTFLRRLKGRKKENNKKKK